MNVTQFDFEDKLEITGLVYDGQRPIVSIMMRDCCWGRWDRSADCTERCSISECQHLGLINFAGPMNNFILSIVVYSLLAFMRGGAIIHYSNNVQVAPMGRWLRLVLKVMFRSFKLTTIPSATGMSWQMLSKKQPRIARQLPELTLEGQSRRPRKRSQSEANQVRESLLSGCDKQPQDGICG